MDYQIYLFLVLLQVDCDHVPAEAALGEVLVGWKKIYEVFHHPKSGGNTAEREPSDVLAIDIFEFLVVLEAKKHSLLSILVVAGEDLVHHFVVRYLVLLHLQIDIHLMTCKQLI